ncbi:methyltransferase domain-containing protein [bacterium]|nr:methyltransferase domain-containing protein [bacterium]
MKSLFIKIGRRFLYRTIEKNLVDCKSVLDVGCGSNSPLGKMKLSLHKEGVDIFEPAILESKNKGLHNKYRIIDILDIGKAYSKKSFDAVVALEVVEHFKKQEAIELIKKMESIAKKRILISTPNGFLAQETIKNNPYEVHQSGWCENELKDMGYKCYGIRGFKFIRGKKGRIKYKPWFFWGVLAAISELLVFFYPKMSFGIFAVKDL